MRTTFLLTLILLTGWEAYANNVIIPNYYRNRRVANIGPAIGWSDRKEAAFRYEMSDSELETNGAKASETESTTLGPVLFYRTPVNINIEAGYGLFDADSKPVSSATDTSEGNAMNLGLGYELTGAPMVFAVHVSNLDIDSKDGATGSKTKLELQTVGLGAGYKLPSDIYLGFNLLHIETDFGTSDDETDLWTLGMGQVFGDRANPTEAYEVRFNYENEDSTTNLSLNFAGLMNRDNIQYYASFGLGQDSGDTEGNSLDLTLGADLLFGGFFVGPQLDYSKDEEEDGASKEETTEMDWSVQGGFRNEQFEAALTLELNSEEEEDNTPVQKDETEGQTIALRGSYFF